MSASHRGPVLVPFAGHSHDWAAAELGAWLGGGAVTLLGVRGRDGAHRDASRLLASASLALQRGAGIRADTLLTGEGAGGVLEAAAGAATLVVGLSERWQSEGLGKARTQLVREALLPRRARAAWRPPGRPRAAGRADAIHLVGRALISAPTTGRTRAPIEGGTGRCGRGPTGGRCGRG